MAEKTINARIQCKIDTAENWKTNNPVLLVGELGIESDTKLIKVGDGTTSWTSLPYLQYLPLSGGAMTGALKIASGYDKGIQDSEGNNLLYMSSDYVLNIRNEAYNDIYINGLGEIKIGGNKITSDINVIGRSFSYNDKSVAVTSDIPKTLNNKKLVANGNTTIYGTDITLSSDNTSNVTDAINGKADTSAIPTSLSQLSEDTTHRVVTDTEKATWNAKSNFDGNYNSLTNKPTIPINADFTLAGLKEKSYNSLTDKPTIPTKTSQLTNDSSFATTSAIPTKTSQLTNDSGFINKDVNNLTNYLPLTGGTLTGHLSLTRGNSIKDSDGNILLSSTTYPYKTDVGNTSQPLCLLGSNMRPTYYGMYNGVEQTPKALALYTDIPDVKKLGTTNWTVSQDSYGNLVFKYE